jgi:type IV pilus assembly protein PilM
MALPNLTDRRILCVDWDAREVRVVHASFRRQKLKIEDVLAVSIPKDVNPQDADQLGGLLKDLLAQERIGCRRVIVDIPRNQAVLNTLSLPRASISDLAGMVAVQIGKALPFPLEDAVIDFAAPTEGGEDTGPCDILIGAVRREELGFYRQVCEAAGLRLERIGLRPYANRMAIHSFLGPQLPERVLIVDVGPGLTEIDVLHNGQLVFSRAADVYVPREEPAERRVVADSGGEGDDADFGTRVITFGSLAEAGSRDTSAVVADIIVEVTRSLEAYRATDAGAQMDCAVVAGGTGLEETLAEALHRRFGIRVETYNPSAILDDDPERGAAAMGFAAALGLVLTHAADDPAHFDFLHPKRQEMAAQVRLRKMPRVAAVLALFVIAGIAFYVQGPAKDRARIAELEEQIANTKAEIKENSKLIRIVKDMEEFEKEQVVWLDVLNELIALLPNNKEVVLTNIDMYQADRKMVIGIRAADQMLESRIVDKLSEYRPEGHDGQYLLVSRSTTSRVDGDYPFQGSLTIRLLDGGA